MGKSKTYSLYLAKENAAGFLHLLSETARTKVAANAATTTVGNMIGERSQAYIFDNPDIPPKWLSEVRNAFPAIANVTNSSSAAVIFFEQDGRTFAITYAHGWMYLDDTKFVADFGLRVAINTVEDTSVNRIEHNHLGEGMKGISHSPFQRDIQSFGIEEALEIVKRVAGPSGDKTFAKTISGATVLKLTLEEDLSDIGQTASDALSNYSSTRYQKTGFSIIDKVKPILDKVVLDQLDNQAVSIIRAGKDNFELAMPGWSDEDVVYYGFRGAGLKGRHPNLLMKDYRNALGPQKLKRLTPAQISNNHTVFAEFNNNSTPPKSWSIKKALVGSVTVNSGLYAINEGDWFQLDQAFKIDIDQNFNALVENWPQNPLVPIKKISPDGKKIGLETELEYNERCAISYSQLCLDQKIITVPEIQYGKFEACDLLDIAGRRLIHVKKSSRQSSVISHFFKQGSNSAKILKTFPEAISEVIKKVENDFDVQSANALRLALGDTLSGWTVEYHFIDSPRNNGQYAIPFFSRITLREETRLLKGMGFKVKIRFIPMP